MPQLPNGAAVAYEFIAASLADETDGALLECTTQWQARGD